MPEPTAVLVAVLVAAAITFALRALPFAIVEPLRGARATGDLAAWMPAGLLAILVVYLLRDVPSAPAHEALATVAPVLVVAGLYVRTGNALVSIGVGTALHVVLL